MIESLVTFSVSLVLGGVGIAVGAAISTMALWVSNVE